MDTTVRIAMWSGPRNLSTAMMRAFASRADCGVVDEPFYAPFLAASGLDHPMREAILDRHEADPARVAAACRGPAPGGEPLFYQKHMTHHMLPGFDLSFMEAARNAFLIRDPARVVASYEAKREQPTFRGSRLRTAGRALRAGGGPARQGTARRRFPGDRDGTRGHAGRGSAKRSTFPSTRRCCPGRPVPDRRTARGARTGTTRSTARPGSRPPTARRRASAITGAASRNGRNRSTPRSPGMPLRPRRIDRRQLTMTTMSILKNTLPLASLRL